MTFVGVVPVRDGRLPLGADEVTAEAGGRVLLAGSGTDDGAAQLTTATEVRCVELKGFAPGTWAAALAPMLRREDVVVLPASPDGRDLAPRLAAALDRPLLAGAVAVHDTGATVVRYGDRVGLDLRCDGPFVATLVPGVRGAEPVTAQPTVEALAVDVPAGVRDAEVEAVLEPEPETMDLAEAPRILGGGAGLVPPGADGAATFRLLAAVAAALGASMGATRVATDAGWTGYDRQIGTTGVVVNPDLYIAFGVSGAAQHIGGLGQPKHVVSVNTDPSCPMTAMADLGLVVDAPTLLAELARRLGVAEAADPSEEVTHA
ncbi:electron transfer flavoprotein subunit alpha/FixB family protein [Carbonactinospora thermoautotrophica]|nr:electron transfer flavoprotein subunit alpha/FixB family protein [Carbonactinospora thermoautotrophica]